MAAVDPTYPLYPIANILSSMLLLLVLISSFVRRSWNFGVTSLCLWVFLENLTLAVDAIIWSDNAEVKLHIYCDIVSHVQLIAYAVKSMAPFTIARRLYLIASLQSSGPLSAFVKRRNMIIEWSLGLLPPVLVAGPLYYINQRARFLIVEGFGCMNAPDVSVLELLTLQSWAIIPPLVSMAFYYPRTIWLLYRQRQDIDVYFRDLNPSASSNIRIRASALAGLCILFTLPFGAVNIALTITSALELGTLPFYRGWDSLHRNYKPLSYRYAILQAEGATTLGLYYFSSWTSPILAFAIFGLFGVTSEARASYWRIVRSVGIWLGGISRRTSPSLGEMGLEEVRRQSTIVAPAIEIRSDLEVHGAHTEGRGVELSVACALPGESEANKRSELEAVDIADSRLEI